MNSPSSRAVAPRRRIVISGLALPVWAALLCLNLSSPSASLWRPCAISLCESALDQRVVSLSDDLAGGFFLVVHSPYDAPGLLAYRVYPSGEAAAGWPGCGSPLTTGIASWACPSISDGDGGMLVAFRRVPDSYAGYLQRMTGAGSIAPGWPADGVRISTAYRQDYPRICPDGAGGALIAWATGNPQAWATRIAATGTVAPGWPAEGRLLFAIPTGQLEVCQPVADGAGGALFLTADLRDYGNSGVDIYAQHFRADGSYSPGWGAEGEPVCVAPGDQGAGPHGGGGCGGMGLQNRAVSDGAGGAISVWSDSRDEAQSGVDIYAQRIDGAGTLLWDPLGVPLCRAPDNQGVNAELTAIADGAGGAYVAWKDCRDYGDNSYDLYLQRVDADGAIPPGWPADGLALAPGEEFQNNAVLASDGAGGVFALWHDYREPVGYRLLRIDPSGQIVNGWPSSGLHLCPSYSNYISALLKDGAGGVFIAWSQSGDQPLVQRIGGDGVVVSVPGDAAPAAGSAIALRGPFPNPATDELRFELELAEMPDPGARSESARRTAVEIRILDPAGRIVRTLPAIAPGVSGSVTIEWDGLDSRGRPAPAGVYFLRAETAAGRAVAKAVLVR